MSQFVCRLCDADEQFVGEPDDVADHITSTHDVMTPVVQQLD